MWLYLHFKVIKQNIMLRIFKKKELSTVDILQARIKRFDHLVDELNKESVGCFNEDDKELHRYYLKEIKEAEDILIELNN